MKKKHHKAEEIVAKLREIEKMQAGGKTIEEACKELGITDYYRWRKLYGKMPVDELKRLKELEKENARLKRMQANLGVPIAASVQWQRVALLAETLLPVYLACRLEVAKAKVLIQYADEGAQ